MSLKKKLHNLYYNFSQYVFLDVLLFDNTDQFRKDINKEENDMEKTHWDTGKEMLAFTFLCTEMQTLSANPNFSQQ